MYIPIIVLFLWGAFLSVWYRDDSWAWDDFLFTGLIATFAGVITSLVLIAALGWMPVFDTGRITNSYSLSAISDGQSTSGSFFLGSGFIDSQPSFAYYVNQDGVIRLYSAPAEKSDIRYTNGAPTVEITKSDCPAKTWLPSWECMGTKYIHYTFKIPYNSVRPTYTLPSK